MTRWRPSAAGGLRLDTHIYEGYLFPPFYDALMGKQIAWAPDRAAADRADGEAGWPLSRSRA